MLRTQQWQKRALNSEFSELALELIHTNSAAGAHARITAQHQHLQWLAAITSHFFRDFSSDSCVLLVELKVTKVVAS